MLHSSRFAVATHIMVGIGYIPGHSSHHPHNDGELVS